MPNRPNLDTLFLCKAVNAARRTSDRQDSNMLKSYIALPLILSLGLAGCGYSPVSKSDAGASASFLDQNLTTPLTAADQSAELIEQAATLDRMMADIVRNSTAKGAMIGAAVGCGVALVASSNAASCVTRAAAGGLVGAVAGNKAGNRDGVRRVEIVSVNALSRNIRRTNDQMDDIHISLRDTLARQEIELADLRNQRDAGQVSAAAYNAHVATIKRDRAELAHALTLSFKQAKAATAHLQEAAAKGQTGLEWHMSATSQLTRDIESARSQITLL